MTSRIWFARTLFYFWLAVKGPDAVRSREKRTAAQHRRRPIAVQLRPVKSTK